MGNNRRHVADQLHGTIGRDSRATSLRAKMIKHPESVKSQFDGAPVTCTAPVASSEMLNPAQPNPRFNLQSKLLSSSRIN